MPLVWCAHPCCMEHLADWGSASTYNHYHAGWAWAGNTPFQYYKQVCGVYESILTST